jgi:hypothetical protein
MPDSTGEILRWVLLIDGEEVSEADVRVLEHEGRSVMLVTDGREELEPARWREGASGTYGEPAAVRGHPRRLTATGERVTGRSSSLTSASSVCSVAALHVTPNALIRVL